MNRSGKILALIAFVFLTASCGDDDEIVKPLVDPVEIPTEFSEFTPEENKSNLEDNGLELVNNMTQFKSTAGIKTTISFNHFLTVADLPELSSGRKATSVSPLAMIRNLASLAAGKTSASTIFSGFRMKEEDPITAQEMFDELEGVFAFNSADDTWTHTPGTDGRIVFRFPSTETGTTNDAEFAIYGYTSVQVNNVEAEYTGDVPTALKADLTVAGTKQIEYSFSAAYKDNGEPTTVKTTVKIGSFIFSTEVVNTTQEVSTAYSWKNGDTNLISLGAIAKGNFTSENIEGSESAGAVVTDASAYFQLMDIKFAGVVDVAGLDQGLQGELTPDQEATAWNANVEFVVFYATSNQKIADAEFYGVSETESGTDCYEYDINGDGVVNDQDCYSWSYTDEYVDVRMIFADGSKSDLATYTEVGFEELTTELEEFVDAVQADLD